MYLLLLAVSIISSNILAKESTSTYQSHSGSRTTITTEDYESDDNESPFDDSEANTTITNNITVNLQAPKPPLYDTTPLVHPSTAHQAIAEHNNVLIDKQQTSDTNNDQNAAPKLLFLASKAWVSNNWGKIAVGSIAAMYGLTVLGLRFATQCIEKSNSWSCWHNEIPVANLRMLDTGDVARELVDAITTQYPPSAPVIAIALFLKDTDAEIEAIHRYLSLCAFLEKANVLGIFPPQTASRNLAQEKRERLVFLQNIIAGWPYVLSGQMTLSTDIIA